MQTCIHNKYHSIINYNTMVYDYNVYNAVADLGGDLRVPWNPPFSPGYVQTL